MECGSLCRLNATLRRLFRVAKSGTRQTEQLIGGPTNRDPHTTALGVFNCGQSIDEGTDDACCRCLMFHHRQMTASAEQYGLHVGEQLRQPQLLRRRDNCVFGSDDNQHRHSDLRQILEQGGRRHEMDAGGNVFRTRSCAKFVVSNPFRGWWGQCYRFTSAAEREPVPDCSMASKWQRIGVMSIQHVVSRIRPHAIFSREQSLNPVESSIRR